jgi:hypothetical protein
MISIIYVIPFLPFRQASCCHSDKDANKPRPHDSFSSLRNACRFRIPLATWR